MQRIKQIDESEASPETAALLKKVRGELGGLPNILATMAQSPSALAGYLGLAGALKGGHLPARTREQIALAVAGANRCDYCASAHSALGKRIGLSPEETARNLAGRSSDAKTQAALDLAQRIIAERGLVADQDLEAARRAGYGESELVEILAHVVLNVFTNYFNHLAHTEIDFPLVETSRLAAA